MGYAETLKGALEMIEGRAVETRWSRPRAHEADIGFRDMEGLVRDTRRTMVNARPEDVFRVLSGIAGEGGLMHSVLVVRDGRLVLEECQPPSADASC